MKVTIFTSNQPRHIGLIELFSEVCEETFAITESNAILPHLAPEFQQKSPVMQRYFSRMTAAEEKVFGRPRLLPARTRSLVLKAGDLNRLKLEDFGKALQADLFVVFGASYIQGHLCDFLVSKGALNIHMGLSPYYRGAACNFWALYDERPQYVGATIHRLSKGLDSGPMLFHALPKAAPYEAFEVGMVAVKAAQLGLLKHFQEGSLADLQEQAQDKTRQLRYSRTKEFTEEIAAEYLERTPTPESIHSALKARDLSLVLRPEVY